MLSLKFPVTLAMRGHLKIAKNHYFALIFSIKIDFKVLQLPTGLRLSQRLFSLSAFKQHFSNKTCVGGLNKAFFSSFETTKRGGMKNA
jgi:hypothetical protein